MGEGAPGDSVKSSTLSANHAYQGGAIHNRTDNIDGDGSVTLINSTISHNEARGNNSAGGGLSFLGGNAETIKNTTITENTADGHGGGVYSGRGSGPRFKNTIVANNSSVNFLSEKIPSETV